MRNRSSENKQGGRGGTNANDFISKMPDEVLVMILCLLPLKDAVATSTLSTRWRLLWCSVNNLSFDGTVDFYKIAKDMNLLVSERNKYVNKVNSVIQHHNNPIVKNFEILSDLDESHSEDIDKWLCFVVPKKVEKLKLDLMTLHSRRDRSKNYDLPLPLSDGNMVHLAKWPSSSAIIMEMSLKKLDLQGVNVSETTLKGFLKRAPRLEELYIYGAVMSSRIHVGGRDINLKHFKLVGISGVDYFSLYDFDLVSLTYIGSETEFNLTNLPKLTELDIARVCVGLEDNVFFQFSSCASSLQVLYLDIEIPEEGLNVNAIPLLPNVKSLMLTIGAEGDDSLLEFTAIAKACPKLEIFEISLHWLSPIRRRRKVRKLATHPHEHLKVFQFVGYYGRTSDLELLVYVINNAASLRKIVIDPCCRASGGDLTAEEMLKSEDAARSSAKQELKSILPLGVELVIASKGIMTEPATLGFSCT